MTVGSTATSDSVLSPAARIERLDATKLPTKRDEAWRYAPLGDLGRLSFGPGSAVDVPSEIEKQIPDVDGPRIVVVNGVVDSARSTLSDQAVGLRLSTVAAALDEQPEKLAAHFALADGDGADGYQADAFDAVNIAHGNDGALIEVAAGAELDSPIHVVDVTIPDTDGGATCTAVVIELGEGASATVVETRIGGGSEFGGSNTRTTIALGDNATLDHVVLQDVPPTQIHLSRVGVVQGAASEYRARSFNLGAVYGRFAYDVTMEGEGARADLSGLYFGFGDQTLDQQVTVVHGAKDCTSRQSFRGVLDDESTGVFNGGIDVRPGADGTDAEQSNDNLLLSTRAEVNTQPRLEILADDVACKHGATVGQLDDTAMYYMRSRGIAAEEARRLLIDGFADQVVDDVEIETVRAWIKPRLGHSNA